MTTDDWDVLRRLREWLVVWDAAPDGDSPPVSDLTPAQCVRALEAVETHCEQLMRLVEKIAEVAAAIARERRR